MRDTIQVVAHVRPVSDLCSRLEDAERHVGGARTQSKGRGHNCQWSISGEAARLETRAHTVTLMLRIRKLRH